jgi:hypothetical protein
VPLKAALEVIWSIADAPLPNASLAVTVGAGLLGFKVIRLPSVSSAKFEVVPTAGELNDATEMSAGGFVPAAEISIARPVLSA